MSVSRTNDLLVFYLLLLQLVLCRVAAPYIIHSADYILFRFFDISIGIQSVLTFRNILLNNLLTI